MSIRAMSWAWQQDTKSSGERLVLLALADHAGEDGECWPHTGSLGQKCGIDARTVQRHLTSLCERGLVTKVHRRKRADGTLAGWLYRLNVDQADTTPTSCLRGDIDVVTETRHPRRVLDTTSTSSHEPSGSNHQKEPSLSVEIVDEFDRWWQTYPRKTGKQAAMKAWQRLDDTSRRAAVEALPHHVAYWEQARTASQFIPHPATWLNGRRFDDELTQPEQPQKHAPGMDMVRRVLEEARQQ